MTKRSRYLLLLLGFLFFLAAAPAIVLYVQGISIDFETGSFIKTGILSVKSQPSNAHIYLNGKLVRQGSGNIRFLTPAEYKVEIKKDGYFTWTKRLKIHSSQVTFANPAFNSIYLFKDSQSSQILEENVTDFYGSGETLAVLGKDFAVIPSSKEKITNADRHKPSSNVNKISAIDSNEKNFLLTNDCDCEDKNNALIYNSASKNFYDISKLATGLETAQFGEKGELYLLESGGLYKIEPAKQSKTLVLQNVKAFFVLGTDIYYIKQNADTPAALLVSTSPYSENQELLSNLPTFTESKIFATFEKQIFILADGDLFKANSNLERIQSNVSDIYFDAPNSTLTVFAAGEFGYISGMNKNLNFVTRSSEKLKNLNVNYLTGYGLYSKQGKIFAVELDSRDGQNTYELYTGKNTKKFATNGDADKLWVLDNGQLKILSVR